MVLLYALPHYTARAGSNSRSEFSVSATEYEKFVVRDAVLRTKLDNWYLSVTHALEMSEHHSRVSMEALERGDRETALEHSAIALEWAEKVLL